MRPRSEARPRPARAGFLLLLAAALLSAALGVAETRRSPGLDRLLGGQGRARLQQRMRNLSFAGGKVYPWQAYADWGRKLFFQGFVDNPPTGPTPSKPISKFFKCAQCHNYQREDPVLTRQDPEARFRWIEQTGQKIRLIQGATVWGMVNRTTFFPDYFAIYHNLCVPKVNQDRFLPCGPVLDICGPGCRTMDPARLEDAVQICSNYCSVGRYLNEWELYSLLAFFWDLEIRLDDLGLPPDQAQEVQRVLTAPRPDPERAAHLRRLLRSKFASKAGNTYRGIPQVDAETLAARYPDGPSYQGDAERGQKIYKLSCIVCHGSDMEETAKHLGGDPDKFYKMLAKGTRSSFRPYMPNFTLQRLSRRQAADILAYLQGFLGKGDTHPEH